MHLLDTNICIYVLNERSRALRQKFNVTKDLCISAITYAELCFGIENGLPAMKKQRYEQLDLFTRLLHILPFDEAAAMHYGRIRTGLKQRGEMIGGNDLLIAAHALSVNAILVTNNIREFDRIGDLTLENWAV